MRVWRALVDLESRADTQPGYEAIQNIVTEDPSAVDAIADNGSILLFAGAMPRRWPARLASLPPEGIIRLRPANASLLL